MIKVKEIKYLSPSICQLSEIYVEACIFDRNTRGDVVANNIVHKCVKTWFRFVHDEG